MFCYQPICWMDKWQSFLLETRQIRCLISPTSNAKLLSLGCYLIYFIFILNYSNVCNIRLFLFHFNTIFMETAVHVCPFSQIFSLNTWTHGQKNFETTFVEGCFVAKLHILSLLWYFVYVCRFANMAKIWGIYFIFVCGRTLCLSKMWNLMEDITMY